MSEYHKDEEGNETVTSTKKESKKTWKETFSTINLKRMPSIPSITLQQFKDKQQNIKSHMEKVINNVKYGQWNLYPYKDVNKDYDKNKSIYLLGKEFSDTKMTKSDLLNFEQFIEYFRSRLWFTYRINIPSIPYTKETGDCGWGCVIRVIQMMTAQAYSKLFIDDKFNGNYNDYLKILSLFDDSCNGPLGLSNFVKYPYENYKKKVGSWFSPSEAAQVMNHLLKEQKNKGNEILDSLSIYCTINSCLVLEQLEYTSDNWRNSVFLIIPVRLGIKYINECYYEHITKLFSLDNCLGIMGGKARRSLYFIGSYNESLIYLDPHVMQEYVNLEEETPNIETFFCSIPKRVLLSQIDPSCAIGFLIKNREELDRTVYQLGIHQIATYEMADGFYKKVLNPIFTIIDQSSQLKKYVPNNSNSYNDVSEKSNPSDDFEML
uniref:Cysteine protease n=1 Tax=Strongyloides papillosus TaxID=174720 RepID=A0A0N5B7L5_STREA